MGPTKEDFHTLADNSPAIAYSRTEKGWLGAFILLPYLSWVALVVMLGLLARACAQRAGQVFSLWKDLGLGWLSVGLLLSASFGLDRGEAFLQLSNFLPFFLLFAVMATLPGMVRSPFAKLESLARWLLLTSVPLTAVALLEYGIKFAAIAPWVQALPLPPWLLSWIYEPDFGHRAHSAFSHPNTLSAYLVMIFGLGLGLVLKAFAVGDRPSAARTDKGDWLGLVKRGRAGLVGAFLLCLSAIFCTGSRNGVLIALVLMAIALYQVRHRRWAWLIGLAAASAIAAAVMGLGIGGRSLSLALITQDPRLGVWRLALEMIAQRPWLGWGFGGLRLLYIPGSIPDYDSIAHAHNLWLFLASEAGIPVMLGFCVIVGKIFYGGIVAFGDAARWQRAGGQGDRAVFLGYLLAFASALLFSLFDVTLFDARINTLSWGLLAAIYAMVRGTSLQKMG